MKTTHGAAPLTRRAIRNLWAARATIDDNTKGKVWMDGITFEVNGQMRSQVIAP